MSSESAADSTQGIKRNRTKIALKSGKLRATCVVPSPGPDDLPLTIEEIEREIAQAGITVGVDLTELTQALCDSRYDEPITIATGKPMVKGEDARFEYHFETDLHRSPVEGPDGLIDYRDLNYLQNTTEGELLARLLPPTEGTPGMTVTGEEIPPVAGKARNFTAGEGTRVTEDGLELYAATNGAIIFSQGRISVKELTVVSGDVDFSVGNIECSGSLKITGNVNAGFSLKVEGNLDIGGNVEDCTIDVGGNVILRGGFFGSGGGYLKAGGDITIKYADSQRLECGGDLVVGGELLNCRVTAGNSVRIQGSKGKLVGGEVNAGKEIWAVTIGSDAGTITELTVAYNADLVTRYREIVTEEERVQTDQVRVKDSLCQLYKLQMAGTLSEAQEQVLQKLEKFHHGVPAALEALAAEKALIAERLQQIEDARVVAKDIAFPGVVVCIGILTKELDTERRACLFCREGHSVQVCKYDPQKHGR